MIKLYYHPSPNPAKVALFLEEAGLPYEMVPVDTRRGDQFEPEFLEINPNGKTPALTDGDVKIFDSNAILLYLAEKTGKFLPEDTPQARGQMLSWLMFVATGIGPYCGQAVHFSRAAPEKLPYAINRYTFEAKRHWGLVEAQLAKHRYMLGDTYTLIDMSVWGWATRIPFALGEEALATMPTDIEIARAARLKPVAAIAETAGIPEEALNPYGKFIAKVDTTAMPDFGSRPDGKLILVTAINPTPAGEGKTTTTVGLGDGLKRIGKRAMIALREPSLGPCFGMKGGAAGGGYAQVVPMEQINLHFTGDFHAITSAHNLLTALLDNHIHWGNKLDLDARNIALRRVMDMNDRALRAIVSSLGGNGNGYPREDGFDITVASEVMAIFCLARDLDDLEERLGRIVVGKSRAKQPVTAAELKATGAMSVLLKDALMPNLVQTLEGTPAFVHGGPFANIAHGCNSVIATSAALKLADYVVTEAGFGADLGAEKFFDIKCRKSGLKPDAAVIVATVRALKMHGGLAKEALGQEDVHALQAGLSNLARHVENIRKFGVPPIVAINNFNSDTHAEHELIRNFCRNHLGVEAVICRHWAEGGKGAEELAHKVAVLAEGGEADFAPLYPDEMPLKQKLETIAREIYGAAGLSLGPKVATRFAELEEAGHGHLPICVAKTQYSFSADPTLRGAPSGHIVPVRELRLSAGAGFVVAICGDIMTMPGLPREPAAERIHVDAQGQIEGLF